MRPRTVLIIVFDGVQSLDVTGPLEVFSGANSHLAGHGSGPAYRIVVAGPGGTPVRTSSGLTLVPGTDLRVAPAAHTLVVPGGEGTRSENEELTAWLRRHAPTARRITSVCTGAFLLARAGLLAGRRVTTHWAYAEALQRQFPGVNVDPEPIYVRDGCVVTSAGVTAGIDLALALVEEDIGREAALDVARHPGGLPAPPGRPGAVQRAAAGSAGAAPPAARGTAVGHRAPGRGPVRAQAGGPGRPVTPAVRPQLRRRDRHDAGPVRGPGPPGGGPPRA